MESDPKTAAIETKYDPDADVFYLSFGPPSPADNGVQDENGVLHRFSDGKLIGLTFLNFKERHLS